MRAGRVRIAEEQSGRTTGGENLGVVEYSPVVRSTSREVRYNEPKREPRIAAMCAVGMTKKSPLLRRPVPSSLRHKAEDKPETRSRTVVPKGTDELGHSQVRRPRDDERSAVRRIDGAEGNTQKRCERYHEDHPPSARCTLDPLAVALSWDVPWLVAAMRSGVVNMTTLTTEKSMTTMMMMKKKKVASGLRALHRHGSSRYACERALRNSKVSMRERRCA
mmetsp:Transcript_10399/g.32010  ORF Transcript_10399/g.32010 Transcript_10399/m.32010 type:complete len:220 (+) Transcript_10399:625-1284(+)